MASRPVQYLALPYCTVFLKTHSWASSVAIALRKAGQGGNKSTELVREEKEHVNKEGERESRNQEWCN